MLLQHTWKECYKIYSSLSVLLMMLEHYVQHADGDTSADVNHHLEMGKRMLAAGQLTEALSHYHSAVDGEPDNYLNYFKRATVLLALGRSKTALPDLDKVITLRPDFLKARVQRANIFLKQGSLDEAAADYVEVIKQNPGEQEAQRNMGLVSELRRSKEQAQEFYENEQYSQAIDVLASLVEASPWDVDLRKMRATCYEMTGEVFKAIQDLKPLTKLINDNTDGHLKISELYYDIGDGEESLKEIRECLKLDQDHKACHKHYKKVKKLVKFFQDAQKYMDAGQFDDALLKLNAAYKFENKNPKFVLSAKEKMCTCHLKVQNVEDAIQACTETINLEPNNVNAYCDRAEAFLLQDKLDEALADYQSAKEKNNDLRRAKEGIDKVNKLIKQSKKRDYYKILGVTRTASKPEIMKKFRKMAAKWHPDKFKDEDRKDAEKKFIDLAAAKEVLTDPEKRAKYDQGEDPLDPEAQQNQGHNPFQGFDFNEFGGFSGFKFHFN